MLLRSPVNSEDQSQRFTLGNLTINHSLSQELEDTIPLLTIWICSNISKITLTLTFLTKLTLITSLEPPRLSLLTLTPNITMENMMIQQTTTSEKRKNHTDQLSADCRKKFIVVDGMIREIVAARSQAYQALLEKQQNEKIMEEQAKGLTPDAAAESKPE